LDKKMEKNETVKVNLINKYIYLYNIFPFLSESDFTKLKTINKHFRNLLTDYKAIYESDLKKLALVWKFNIDTIDIDRATASTYQRVYPTSIQGEYRVIKADRIICTSSAVFGVLKKVNNSLVDTILDRGSLCGGRILSFSYYHDLDLSIACNKLIKGRYKLFIRHTYHPRTNTFSEIVCSVNVKDSRTKWKKIYEGSFFGKEEFLELLNERRVKGKYGSSRIRRENFSVSLMNSYLTELDLCDDSENLQVVFRLKCKKENEYMFGWFLDGVVLEYCV
jgi:hypothetical protein